MRRVDTTLCQLVADLERMGELDTQVLACLDRLEPALKRARKLLRVRLADQCMQANLTERQRLLWRERWAYACLLKDRRERAGAKLQTVKDLRRESGHTSYLGVKEWLYAV